MGVSVQLATKQCNPAMIFLCLPSPAKDEGSNSSLLWLPAQIKTNAVMQLFFFIPSLLTVSPTTEVIIISSSGPEKCYLLLSCTL